jgi:histidinol-phosphatase (PHP family)
MESWLEELHARTPLSYIIGSVHPQLKEYKEAYFGGDHVAYFRQYFDHLAWMAETGLVDCVSHPDLVKNIFPAQWDIDAVMDDIKRALDRIAETDTAMELNTSGVYKAIPEMNPAPTMLMQMAQRGIPVVLGSDSHTPGRVAEGFEEGLDMLKDCGYTEVSFYIDRQRHSISIPVARDSLKRR